MFRFDISTTIELMREEWRRIQDGREYLGNGHWSAGAFDPHEYMSGLQPLEFDGRWYLGLRPRLVYAGPLALRSRYYVLASEHGNELGKVGLEAVEVGAEDVGLGEVVDELAVFFGADEARYF